MDAIIFVQLNVFVMQLTMISQQIESPQILIHPSCFLLLLSIKRRLSIKEEYIFLQDF